MLHKIPYRTSWAINTILNLINKIDPYQKTCDFKF